MARQSETLLLVGVIAAGAILYSQGKLKFLDDLLKPKPGGGGTTPPPAGGGGGGGGGGGLGPPDGEVLWDSNTDGGWNNGQARTVDGEEGNQEENGKGFYTAASGNPRFHIDGQGVGTLEADAGHGRIYVQAINYNARLEGELKFDTDSLDNTTWKLRNRHGQGGACENRFGGIGGHLERTSSGFKIERCHNEHESGHDAPLPREIPLDTWIGFKFTATDTEDKSGIYHRLELDYGDGAGFVEVNSQLFTGGEPFYWDEATFMQGSNFWIRINNESTASASYRNVRLIKVAPVPNSTAARARAYYNVRTGAYRVFRQQRLRIPKIKAPRRGSNPFYMPYLQNNRAMAYAARKVAPPYDDCYP